MHDRDTNAASESKAVAHEVGNTAGPVVQRTIKPVTEEVIINTKANNPELEEDYFDGLYYDSEGKTYVYAGTLSENFVKEDGSAFKNVALFIPSEQMTEDAVNTFLESTDLATVTFVSKDEKIKVSGKQIRDFANATGIVAEDLPMEMTYGDSVFQKMFNRAIDAEPIGGGGGEFGNVEFRFKATNGTLFTSVATETVSDEAIIAKWKAGMKVRRMSQTDLEWYIELYRILEMPYLEERAGADFLFVSDDFLGDLEMYDSHEEAAEYPAQSHFDILKQEPADEAPVTTPDAANKSKERTYTRTAIRGDRGQGQKAAMDNTSAKEYVDFFTANRAANIGSWEWLHLQGSRLGGKNEKSNLVAGTASANSAMIPFEREILALSRDSDGTHPVKVSWLASLKSVGGSRTHIGDKIQVNVTAENGTKSNATPRAFSKTFDATEGHDFSKFDRDVAHFSAQQSGGRQ